MSKFLKLFNSHLEYQLYTASNDFIAPNVSRCINLDEVHYTPEPLYLIYEADAKLLETTSLGTSGLLYTNAFKDQNGNTLTITSHTFENGVGTIKFDGDVVTIDSFAFLGCNITSIIIPDSVTSIGEYAFTYCINLTSINIPNSVTSISKDAFGYCVSLTSIVVDSNNTTYDSRNNCNAIIETSTNKLIIGCKNTVISDTVTSIGDSAFFYCLGLTSITIPNSVTSIGDGAFSTCSNLTSITIPNSVTSIGDSAFSSCSGLTSVTIGSGVTSIGDSAFSGCKGLTSITIPDSVTTIGHYAFEGCDGLTSVTIGSGVTSIGEHAFEGCDGLTSVTIGSGVTSIGAWAFTRCSGLASITSNATTAPSISNTTFSSIKTGGTLYVPSGSTGYDVWMGTGNYYLGKYNWTMISDDIIIYKASAKLTETTEEDDSGLHTDAFTDVNGNTLTIISHTFENGVGTIKFNGNVAGIGYEAFYECSGLTSITIPDSVTIIDDDAFNGCTGLTSITIPSGVTSIGNYAFNECSGLTSITIPSSVTSIGSSAFQSCSGLTSIIVDSNNTTYDSRGNCNAIIKTSNNQLIQGCKNTIIPNTVTSIGDYAFSGRSGLTSITIPSSVTSIGAYAFRACTHMTSIDIPSSVTSIGSSAFQSCSGLTSITIPDGVTSINNGVLSYCSNLTSVTLGSGVTSIGGSAFYNCSKLTSIISNATFAPSIYSSTFQNVKTGGTIYVPSGSTGYDTWMGTGDYYLGKYNWTKIEQ